MLRRRFLLLLAGGAATVAEMGIPLVSTVSLKVSTKFESWGGWIPVAIHGERRYIPFWK